MALPNRRKFWLSMPTKAMVLLPLSILPCEILRVTPVEKAIEPESTPAPVSANDPPVTVLDKPSLSTKFPAVTVPLGATVTVPLFHRGLLDDGRSSKVEIYHRPAR